MIKELFGLLRECFKSPNKYLENIIQNNQTRHQILLLILIGIITSLDSNMIPYFKNEKSLIGYLFQSIFLGGIFGWMGLYFLSYAIALVGVFFKSNTHGDKIINIIAYSYVSIILVLFVVLIEFISYSILGFPNEIALLFRIFALAKLIIQIFCIVLLVIGVSKVQGLTILKGLITILVPIIIFSGIIYGFVLIFK